ncbi:MAG: Rieske 2Fe-2S domain-containing protein [Gemmatimonadaceae bacterium]|nr:Rieske 2Fe-2S domain-containing protein [Gemmatimonadaceae bacterium]
MRSKASFRGHPSHPALIPFPFAFLIGALLFDLAGVWLDRPGLWTTGAYLIVAGVIAGLIAAVPGIIDYRYTVPPNSTGKKRATRHALLNVLALILFTAARWLRGDVDVEPDTLILGIEGLGALALITAGWMGGTLVNRNQVGVDHRYANAGKWQDEAVKAERGGASIKVKGGLEVNQMKLLRVDGKRVVLGRTADGYVAFDDHCTHRGGSLAGGVMICGTVQCPWHGSQFDLANGEVKAGPARNPIHVYRVERAGDELEIFGVADSSAS